MAHIVCSFWPIDRTLSGATTTGQSGLESIDNEGVLHIPQISKVGASPSNGLMSIPGYSLDGGFLTLCRDAITVFYIDHYILKNCYSFLKDPSNIYIYI